jgi:glycopeptide antibiotics resistance protein
MLPCWLNPFCKGEIASVTIDAFSRNSFLLLLIPLIFLRRRGKSAGYLLCFYLFSVYAWAVLADTIFDFPVHSVEAEMIRTRSWSREINLVPAFVSGDFNPLSEQVYGNFALGIPFGFGLPFIVARSTHRRMILLGLGFAAGIELAQLLLGLIIYQAPYRVIDIDDVWVVFVGTLVGYGALWGAARIYRRLGWEGGAPLPVWEHVHAVLLGVASADGRSQAQEPPALSSAGHSGQSDDRTPRGPDAQSPGGA